MTKTQAIRQARSESTIYRQGRNWILSAYNPSFRAMSESQCLTYWTAQTALCQWRAERAAELLGWDSAQVGESGSLAERLSRAAGTVAEDYNALIANAP